jgi:hypothetical protein
VVPGMEERLHQELERFRTSFLNDLSRNKTARIIHQFRKTTVLSCHRCLINPGIEEMNNI